MSATNLKDVRDSNASRPNEAVRVGAECSVTNGKPFNECFYAENGRCVNCKIGTSVT